MLIFVIIVAAVLLPVIVGGVLAAVFQVSDTLVENTKEELENRDKGYNPAATLGHKIKVASDDKTLQYRQARTLAAQKAASQPSGANMGIGRLGQSNLKTAAAALDEDVLSAYKIASVNGWDAARLGIPVGGVPEGGAVAVAAAPATAPGGKIVLVAGKDYAVTPITDDMAPADKRKARIANAKAKSAAYKAAKAAGVPAAAPVAAAAAPVAAAPVAAAPVAVDVSPPELVEITDDMAPDEKRKARIANSKAKSAYNKALKAAGIDPKTMKADGAPAPAAAATAPAAPAAAPPAAAPAPSGPTNAPPPPEMIEITDDMPPDEKRAARIANSKAKSAYKKELKALGIDPKSVKI